MGGGDIGAGRSEAGKGVLDLGVECGGGAAQLLKAQIVGLVSLNCNENSL
jgi:hypothetical protein